MLLRAGGEAGFGPDDEPVCQHGAPLTDACWRCEDEGGEVKTMDDEPVCDHDVPLREPCSRCRDMDDGDVDVDGGEDGKEE